jgi:hypothetical protein
MSYFVIVNQHNQKVPVTRDGKLVCWSIRQYVPMTLDEARDLHRDSHHGCSAEGVVKVVEADVAPYAPWGCGVYQYDEFGGSPKLVNSNYDSSG